jgi:phosphoenolpyruvate carboxylase
MGGAGPSFEGSTTKAPLDVVPLFETIEDLEQSDRIMGEYLAHPLFHWKICARSPGCSRGINRASSFRVGME